MLLLRDLRLAALALPKSMVAFSLSRPFRPMVDDPIDFLTRRAVGIVASAVGAMLALYSVQSA
jgi:hypothetical protein